MIEIRNEWQHKGLAKQDIIQIQCPVYQLLECMPEEKTAEEQEMYDALLIVQKYVSESIN